MPAAQTDRSRLRKILDISASVATLLTCGVLVWLSVSGRTTRAAARNISVPEAPLALSAAHMEGSTSAKIGLIVYSDFQCPYCGTFAREILPTLEKEYVEPGRMVVEFRHLPLSMHPLAPKAAQAAECAAAAGKFWEMHNQLFASPTALDEAALTAKAARIGLASTEFASCLAGPADPRIRENTAAAGTYGITGTPAFFLGEVTPSRSMKVRQALTGARPVAEFRKAIDALLDGKVYVTRR